MSLCVSQHCLMVVNLLAASMFAATRRCYIPQPSNIDGASSSRRYGQTKCGALNLTECQNLVTDRIG